MSSAYERMHDAWQRADAAGQGAKDARLALVELEQVYRSLAPDERPDADRAVVEWLGDDDPRRRFDALALVEAFGIASAAVALDRLVERHRADDDAFHEHERERALAVRASLSAG
jgi:hypothetical protein